MVAPNDMLTSVTAQMVRELLHYDPETGVFTWLTRRSNATPAGSRTGEWKNGHYGSISINNRGYRAHRIAWLYMTGEWPEDQVDHIDGDKSNNKWANLRAASNADNQRNLGLKASNKSGRKGVVWDKHHNKWRAQISENGRTRMIGRYKDVETAYEAFCAVAQPIHGEFARL